MRTDQPVRPEAGNMDTSEWSGGAQLSEHECVTIDSPRLTSSVSAALAGVPTGESISRAAFSGEAVCESDATEISGVFEGLLGEASGSRPSRFRTSGSNRLRDSNRLNTAQLMAQAGLSSSQRLWISVGVALLGGALMAWKWIF